MPAVARFFAGNMNLLISLLTHVVDVLDMAADV